MFNLYNYLAKKSLEDLQNEKVAQDLEYSAKFESLRIEMQKLNDENISKISKDAEEKLSKRDQELDKIKERENDMLKMIQDLTITENKLREKVNH